MMMMIIIEYIKLQMMKWIMIAHTSAYGSWLLAVMS